MGERRYPSNHYLVWMRKNAQRDIFQMVKFCKLLYIFQRAENSSCMVVYPSFAFLALPQSVSKPGFPNVSGESQLIIPWPFMHLVVCFLLLSSCLFIYCLFFACFMVLCQAPEELYTQALSQHLELRFLRRLLQLHSSSLTNVEKQGALLPAPDQQGTDLL